MPRRTHPALAAGAVVGAVLLGGCVAGEAARSVCRIDLGDVSLRILENDDTITVGDAADEEGVEGALVVDKTDAAVVLYRSGDDAEVAVLALGRAEEADGTWTALAPDAECRLEDGPAARVGTYTGGAAALDLDGTIVDLPAPEQVASDTLVPIVTAR